MLEVADRERALSWHLNSNHFPPIPEVYEAAVEAIIAGEQEDWDRDIPLPAGVTYRDQDYAPAWACIEAWHLQGFLVDSEEVEDE
jgi:hypothetical protein